jgi:glycosyltransferase involved in cell wall biosynthesis
VKKSSRREPGVRVRILNATVRLDPVQGGGTSERTYQMSKALARQDAAVSILTTDIGLTAVRTGSLLGVRVIALHAVLPRFHVVVFSWSELKALMKDVDVVHMMGHWNILNVLLFILAKSTGTPYVVCPAGELAIFGRSGWIKRLFNLIIGNRIVREADGHVAITPDELPIFASYGINADRVTLIPNGINESDFQAGDPSEFRARFGLGQAPFILFMGRLNAIKGPDLLLDAFCSAIDRFPVEHLVFAGPDGGLLDQLRKTAKIRGVDERVHFVGYLAGRDKSAAYRAADFLVIPSRQEAMSIVALEAGIVGTPVLLTDRCGFNEIAEIGGGLVVEASSDSIRNGIIELLERRSSLAALGERLRNFVRQNYPWERIGRLYLDLFQRLAV